MKLRPTRPLSGLSPPYSGCGELLSLPDPIIISSQKWANHETVLLGRDRAQRGCSRRDGDARSSSMERDQTVN